jgi:membrane protein DedA with SNARE-associated domain
MKFVPFITLTAIGSAVWNIALIGAGAALGDQWDRVGDYVGIFQWLVIAAIFGVILRFTWSKVNARRAR